MLKIKKLSIAISVTVSILMCNINTVASASYNPNSAVNYALRWAGERANDSRYYNPNYVAQSNDCSNFVSQCLHAGGVPFYISNASKIVANNTSGCSSIRGSEWYYIKNKWGGATWSSTWTRVDKPDGISITGGLRQYFGNDESDHFTHLLETTFKSDTYKKVKKGDVILIKASYGDRYSHAVIVSSVKNGEIYYCGHTNNVCGEKSGDKGKLSKNVPIGRELIIFTPDTD